MYSEGSRPTALTHDYARLSPENESTIVIVTNHSDVSLSQLYAGYGKMTELKKKKSFVQFIHKFIRMVFKRKY